MKVDWGKIGNHKLEVLAIGLCFTMLLVSAHALTILWNRTAGATITTSVEYIVVLDSNGTEVASIDFGNVVPSSMVTVYLTIKNTNPNATITINWYSTLSNATDKITDTWIHYIYRPNYPFSSWDPFPATLEPSASIQTKYTINVAVDCPHQPYSWDLYIISG